MFNGLRVDKLIIGYCRVSSQQQFTAGHALERYIEALIQYGIPQSLVYFDVESGISDTREGLNAVLNLVKAGRVSQVIIPNFDRLTRSPLQWEQSRDLFTKHGVQIKFLEDGELDLNSPDGLFTGRIKAALAAQVRDRLRSHSINGHAKHRERQEPYKPIFGYLKVDGAIVPNQNLYPESKFTYFQVARELIDLFLGSKSYGKTLDDFRKKFYTHPPSYGGKIHLKSPSSSTGLKTWISNAILRGKLQYLSFGHKTPQIIIDSTHQPLINENEWSVIKSVFDDNKNRKKGVSSDRLKNPLSGVARCKNCGGMMTQKLNYKNKAGEWTRFLICRSAGSRNGKCSPVYAKTYNLSLESAERQVQMVLVEKANQVSEIIPSEKPANPKIQELIDSINKLSAFDDPDLQEIIERKKTQVFLIKEGEKLETVTSLEKIKLLQYLRRPGFWEEMTPHDRNLVYRELIEIVWCDKGLIEVVPMI
jgi:site-specific DNA recombinase